MEDESKYGADVIYSNVEQINRSDAPIEVNIYDKRYEPVVQHAGSYEMAVVRFAVSTTNIPMFLPFIPDPLLPLTTDLSVTLEFGGNFFTTFVVVSPNDVTYGVFDFQAFLNRVNDAWQSSYNALKAMFPAFTALNPPIMVLDPPTGLIRTYIESEYVIMMGSANVFWNHNTQRMMNFPIFAFNGVNLPNGTDYQLDFDVLTATTMPAVLNRFGFPLLINVINRPLYYVQQPFFSLNLWNQIQSLIITTNLLPVQAEYVPNLKINQNDNSSAKSQSILSDFLFSKSATIDGVRPSSIEYLPTAEYRMLNLVGDQQVRDIQISVFWTDFKGNVYPVLLDPGQTFSMKLIFRRKLSAGKIDDDK